MSISKKKIRSAPLIGIGLAALMMLTGCSTPAATDTTPPTTDTGNSETQNPAVTLRAVTAWDSSNQGHYAPFQAFIDALESETDSGITIDVIGGPETMAPTELAENLSNGTIDIALNTASYYSNTLPESLVLSLTNLTADEWRARGLYDAVNESHISTLNQRVLARLGSGQQYAIYLKDPVNSVSDFQGMRVRGVAVYLGILNQLGAEMVDMPAADIYNGIERGTVQGTAWPYPGLTDLSLEEVVTNVVLPPFYSNGLSLYINEKAWQSLTDSQKEAVERAAIAAEKQAPVIAQGILDRELKVLEEKGIKVTEFTGAEADEYLKKALDGAVEVLVNMGVDQSRAAALIAQFND